MMNVLLRVSFVVMVVMLFARPAQAQNTEGRWALGFYGGGNQWYSDFNERKVGVGGGMMLRYGITPVFSLGITGGYEVLKANQDPKFATFADSYMRVEAIPAALVAWFHLAPGSTFNPYIYVGAGGMLYKRKDGVDNYITKNEFSKSIVVPAGIGFEAFAGDRFSISVDAGYRLADDYTDNFRKDFPDSWLTARAGLNFYLGSGDADDDDDDGLTNGDERRLGTDPANPDTDGDGLKDGEEVKRYRSNPLSIDSDGDGLSDGDEVFKYKTDPTRTDTDDDGLSDGDEVKKYQTDPLKIDTDGDVLTDGEEVLKYKSDPLKVDSDGDSLTDWDEVKTYQTDPSKMDTDNDGLNDGEEVRKYKTDPSKLDTDGGGINDGAEVQRGTNPLDPKDDVVKEVIRLEKGKKVVLEGVTFATGSAKLTSSSETTLEKAFIALVANPDIRVEIAGYTDNVGSVELNDRLSALRAESVKTWLVKKGIEARRMTTVGMGMREPIATNDTPEGRSQNRRIEFHVQQ